MPTVADKRRAFRALHERGCFVLPNPWDAGSAVALQGMGFKALATTSSGAAFAKGVPDGTLSLEDTLANIAEIVAAVDLPVNADFSDGFGKDSDYVAVNVARLIVTGVAGLSIEDQVRGTPALYGLEPAVRRVAAARAAIDAAGSDVMLVARSEAYLVGHPDPLAEATRRLVAYAEAGADVLYAPGVRASDDITAIVAAVAPKPVNVLIGWPSGLGVRELELLGVRRVSVGGALAKTAWAGFLTAARGIAGSGRFDTLRAAERAGDLNALFAAEQEKRG